MIDKLVADVAERSAAIRECGVEIVALRRQVQHYMDRERELRGEAERTQGDTSQESEVGVGWRRGRECRIGCEVCG
jgi:hypothetical protein